MGSHSDLPAMQTNPKIIFFTDFDGTITLKDSNDYMTDNLGYGQEKRRAGNKAVLDGTITFRDSFREMLDSVKNPFDECIRILCDNMKLDPYFTEFYNWAKAHNVPIVILSSGMVPIIHALLVKLLGQEPDHIQIVANQVKAREGKSINEEWGWEIVYHDDSHFGHDKSLEIKPYAALSSDERPTLLYAGDGVSDLSAASQTDLLFAKKGHDLITYCEREKIPFTVFEDWSTILEKTKEIYEGKTNPKVIAEQQLQDA
ncbi:2,3-diketo-5-methylthio-1-phosphopentane phosphatase [Coccidioides immitis RS]|uniref:2,3-diketo-5-methylthio-1-phosphopentane phosphatase n=3 Tax=Coccidioides immitis TaxID=5501 RepID=J3KJ03_COCIM|nr:2,3-diketo-5-methylthio-1-phosphopentane phosphatase [Coccidioides immitis RS]EAS35994.3 2,3-diketo-5-methylthio-1-phosphopentane phosphatase [Coccidioides immitis RS]KMP01290.1 hypothetical protein CIRG_01431 [Coccidioides immitis RMSCC 2394]KMU75424.1 hypothetical protein CISG_05058 [Coccidioides immitis RMSCC 3703]